MAEQLRCWKCGEDLQEVILPMSRREECAHCGADQHVCKLCTQYNHAISGQCGEERAEEVSNKEVANFCDYFESSDNAYQPRSSTEEDDAKRQLVALFGESLPEQDTGEDEVPQLPADNAMKELEDLFSPKK